LKVDVEGIRQHYASLSDDELLEIDRDELTEVAQQCYDYEVTRRGLTGEHETADEDLEPEDGKPAGAFDAHEPDWLDDAACACSYYSRPADSAAGNAEAAREVLEAAGIPCRVSTAIVDPEPVDPNPAPQHEFRVMVPGALNLKATAILDRDLFNADVEAEWRTHFEALSDADLRALTPDVICAGLQDRIARLKRAYNDEVARRNGNRA
jgi:hypothetical protein